MTVTMEGRWRGWCRWFAGMALVALCPMTASALTGASMRDLDDPVPPGGVLTYQITLSDLTPPAPPAPPCFNPPPDCVVTPVTCSNPAPTCDGNTFTGFVCHSAANEGAPCGVGNPLAPDVSLCQQRTAGVCSGGNNNGLPCTADDGALTEQCPGSTLLCARAVNEGDYCGSGFPAQPQPSFCLANPSGTCSGGPNFGLPCTAPHGEPSPTECPSDTVPNPPTPITLTLPIPTGTTFIDADNGGSSDGTTVTWTIAPLNTCGDLGQPVCPTPTVHLMVDALMPVGSVIISRATATDGDGFLESGPVRTTVGTFGLTRLKLNYPFRPDRDGLTYRTRVTLNPGQTINPATEAVSFQLTNSQGTIANYSLAANSLRFRGDYHSIAIYSFTSSIPPLKRFSVLQKGPSHYWIRVDARNATLLYVDDLNVTATLTIGDDVFTLPLTLVTNRSFRRFLGRHP